MIIVDTALSERARSGNPVRVGLIGAGFMGRGVARQITTSFPGLHLCAIYNRTTEMAFRAYNEAGVDSPVTVDTAAALESVAERGGHAVVTDPLELCRAGNLDVLIEATGEIEFGARVTVEALSHGLHVVLMNAELDATVGPLLKTYADRSGVVITNADGDQPGVIMNLFRFVRQIGYRPVLAGNIKGLQDPHRTPKTQAAFAEAHGQKPRMVTSFADGTKIGMEMAVVANATGFKVAMRGMQGPTCSHVDEAPKLFSLDELLDGGIVDYVLGAEPGPGVFVLGYNDDPAKQAYARYLKMGDGPLYLFYVPYHLPHLEAPISAARAVLFGDPTITPAGGPVCDVITVAKRDLLAGEVLDGIGGFTSFGIIDNYDVTFEEDLLPMGLSEGCVLIRDVSRDQPIRCSDVEVPPGRLCDELRAEQTRLFKGK